MSSIETYIEIPVTVYYDHQPAEKATLTYPGCDEEIRISEVTISRTRKFNHTPKSIDIVDCMSSEQIAELIESIHEGEQE